MQSWKDRLMMLPGLAGFAFFYLIPLARTAYYAFIRSPFDTSFVGLANVKAVISNGYFQEAITNTAVFTLLSVSMMMGLCLVLVFLITSSGRSMNTPFMLPVLLPTVAVALIWQALFGQDSLLNTLGVDARTSLILLFVWKHAGLHVVLLLSAISQIPREQMEAASMDGAGIMRRFRSIVLPALLPTLLFCLTYALMSSFRIFQEAYLLYGAYPDGALFMVQHFIYNQFTRLHYPEVASAGLIYALPIALLVGVLFRAEDRTQEV